MSVYFIVEATTKDPDTYGAYIAQVSSIVKKHGGRYAVRGGNITPALGNWNPERIIIIEFPSEQNIHDWLNSEEYRRIAPLREAGADTRAVIVQKYEEPSS